MAWLATSLSSPCLFFRIALFFFLMAGSLTEAGAPRSPGGEILSAEPTFVWIGLEGKPLPWKSREEVLEYLQTADIKKLEKIPTGVTKPRKAFLEKDGVQAMAIFRDVNIQKDRWVDPNAGPRIDFRDSCVYECAAYWLSLLLGMDNIPPVVVRTYRGKKGTLQIWVENSMTETDRLEQKIRPPDLISWSRQWQVVELFDQLVYNDDRNMGNILIDPSWKVWLIDHSRCFRTFSELPHADKVNRCERKIWEKLQAVSGEEIESRLRDLLRSQEIRALVARRQLLVDHIQNLIATHGEEQVLW